MAWLINSAQLEKFRKSQKSLIILDCTWFLPTDNRNAKQEFENKHIISANFFDIDSFSDTSESAPHPHMVISDEKLISEKLSTLGIRNDYKIILYDNSPLHTSCRALWMLKLFGHNPQQLYILDGGFTAWEQYAGKTEQGPSTVSAKTYTATFTPSYMRTLSQMKTNLHNPSEQLIDVRHAVRFAGGAETKPGVRSGHIPGAFCYPYTSFFEKNNCWRNPEKIKAYLQAIGIDFQYPIVSMCGSGISAAIADFTLDILGHENHAVYNGSWNEWGSDKLYPNELSLDERPSVTSLDN